MEKKPHLSDEETEDLVAFLDGELAEDEARAVEARLGQDPVARNEAEALQQAWDLLDYLPRPEVSPNFTHRTLDRVSALRPSTTMAPAAFRRRWLGAMTWVAAVVLAALAGYFLAPLLPASWSPFRQESKAGESPIHRFTPGESVKR